MRPTRTSLLAATAQCDCGWEYDGRNALGLAAQHYDRCGRKVRVEITSSVVYGAALAPGEEKE